MNTKEPLLRVENMEVTFGTRRHPVAAVKDVSFDIYRGETFGLAGESGSGKTTVARAIIGANHLSNGRIVFDKKEISGKISNEMRHEMTRRIQMIFQDPMSSLNERAKVDYIVAEGLLDRRLHLTSEQRQQMVDEVLRDVGLPTSFASRFPHEFSGGQRQRIGIARSLILRPEFVIADEPVSALDISIRAQVINLLAKLQVERGLTYLLISHDLSVMRFLCDRIAVIHQGQLVELAETEKLFTHPLHPYTRALLSAIPKPDPIAERAKKLEIYEPPSDADKEAQHWMEVEPGHFVRGSRQALGE